METNNDRDVFANIVNNQQRNNKINGAVSNTEAMMENDKKSAIQRKSQRDARIEVRKKKEKKSTFAVGFISGVLSISLLLAGVKGTKNIIQKIEKNNKIKAATTELKNGFISRVLGNGLGTINEDGKLDTTSPINLDGADNALVYIARNVMDPDDFSASIQTIKTIDGSGYYIDYMQRLRDIGAIDQTTGTASIAEEEKMLRDEFYEMYENSSYQEILDTCQDLGTKTMGRGY